MLLSLLLYVVCILFIIYDHDIINIISLWASAPYSTEHQLLSFLLSRIIVIIIMIRLLLNQVIAPATMFIIMGELSLLSLTIYLFIYHHYVLPYLILFIYYYHVIIIYYH